MLTKCNKKNTMEKWSPSSALRPYKPYQRSIEDSIHLNIYYIESILRLYGIEWPVLPKAYRYCPEKTSTAKGCCLPD